MYQVFRCLVNGLFVVSSVLEAAPSNSDTQELKKTLEEVDKLWVGEASEASLSMEVKTKNYTRTLDMKYWVKGKTNTLVLITSPKKEKGTATLKINEEMYNYLPKVARTIKVSAALRGGSWMGSHLTNDDLIRSTLLGDAFEADVLEKKTLKGSSDSVWVIKLVPKKGTARTWGKIVLESNQTKRLPIKQQYYDEDMKLVRTITYSQVKKMGNRTLPTVISVEPHYAPDEYTKLTYKSINYTIKLNNDFFSLTRLPNL